MRFRDWLTLSPVFLRSLGRLPLGHLLYMARQLGNENPHRHNGRLHINTFFPPYPSAAFDRFMKAAIKRKRIPYSTYFAVTDECHYHCPHCSYAGRPPGRMNTAQAKDAIRQILSVGTVTLGFTGGEPLMRDDIAELVALASGKRYQVSFSGAATVLFTTGYRLTARLADSLRDAGLDCIMIGVESANPAIHDAIRGVSGSFDEALAAIRLSLNAGLYTAISTVATHDKLVSGDIRAMAELGERLGVHEFRILEPIPTGKLAGEAKAILSDDESRTLAEFHIGWNRRGRGPAVAAFSYLESREMFGCGAGFHHLFVDSLGNVCPCDLTPLSFGNLLTEPLTDIWQRMGTTFSHARCSCLMKDLCGSTDTIRNASHFPLAPADSLQLCRSCATNGAIPEIYRRL